MAPPSFWLSNATRILSFGSLNPGPVTTTVQLDYGTFHGFQETKSFLSFKGLKYADSPRFQRPSMPPSAHLGDVNVTSFAKACLADSATSPGSTMAEDCLFANVYVPTGTRTNSSLPVVVWFHGGGFASGSTQTANPITLFNSTQRPFILASFAYRLGPFGFLGGKQIETGGDLNVGLRDQRAALRWVQRYIRAWGGDPAKVTIWGQSAGAGSTLFHLILENGQNQGLFRAAIGDSPPDVYQPWKDDGYVQTLFNDFASNAGCAVADSFACLKSAPVEKLMAASVKTKSARSPAWYPFQPFVDGKFMTQTVSSALNNGRYVKVPAVFGSNTDDGATWAWPVAQPGATLNTLYDFMRAQWPNITRPTFDKAITKHYPLSNYNNSLVALAGKMYGESRFICTSLFVSGAVSRDDSGYNYIYDNPDATGATKHGADLTAFFNPSVQDPSGLFGEMRKLWTAFMTNDRPAREWQAVHDAMGSPRLLLHPNDIRNLNVDEGLRSRCQFWRSTDKELQR